MTLTLPNYGMTPIGQTAGLEGGAFVARANDASSNWYNPAGLALAEKSSVSSSAGTYQSFSLTPEALSRDDSGGSSQTVPALVGVLVKNLFGDKRWTAGFAAVRTNSFEQETDAQRSDLLSSPATILDYSADSQYRRNEYSLGLGYSCDRDWRFGATLAVANTSLRGVGSVFNQEVLPGGLDATLLARRASGSITQLRLAAGAQYQLTPEILLGAIARTPGLDLFRSGEVSYDALQHRGAQTASLAFFDPDPRFDYQLPFQAAVGAAMELERFQFEVDILFASGSSPYDLFSSERTATLILDTGGGTPPIVNRGSFRRRHQREQGGRQRRRRRQLRPDEKQGLDAPLRLRHRLFAGRGRRRVLQPRRSLRPDRRHQRHGRGLHGGRRRQLPVRRREQRAARRRPGFRHLREFLGDHLLARVQVLTGYSQSGVTP